MTEATTVALTVAQQELHRVVAAHGAPVTVAQLSEETGRHPNSVRELLDALLAAGYVERRKLPAVTRGRRAWGYIAQPAGAVGDLANVAELSAAISTVLAQTAPDPEGQAYAVGRAWGEQFRAQAEPQHEDPAATLARTLGGLGYDPVEVSADRLELHSCPLRLSGKPPHPLVCQLHRGLVDGLLARDDSVVIPFARDEVCVIDLPIAVVARSAS